MDRRELLSLTGAMLVLGGNAAQAQQSAATDIANAARVVRLYATDDGESHVEILTISPDAKPIDVTRMTASSYRGTGATNPVWHTAPRKQFAINMSGELELEFSDGTKHRVGSDLVFLDDLTGKGHITRALGPVTNVFIHVPEDFDVVAWAAGK